MTVRACAHTASGRARERVLTTHIDTEDDDDVSRTLPSKSLQPPTVDPLPLGAADTDAARPSNHVRSHSVDVRTGPAAAGTLPVPKSSSLTPRADQSPASELRPLPPPPSAAPLGSGARRVARSETASPSEPLALAPPPGGSRSISSAAQPSQSRIASDLADLELAFAAGTLTAAPPASGSSYGGGGTASLIDFGPPPPIKPTIMGMPRPPAASMPHAPMRPVGPYSGYAVGGPPTATNMGWTASAATTTTAGPSSARPTGGSGWSATTLGTATAGPSAGRPVAKTTADPFASLGAASWASKPA
jgi:hypothetical protein